MPANIHAIRQGLTEIGAGLQSMSEGVQRIIAALSFEVDAVRMEPTDSIFSSPNWSDSPTGSCFVWAKVSSASPAYMPLISVSGHADMLTLDSTSLSVLAYVFDDTESNYVYGTSAGPDYLEDVWLPVFMDWKTDESAGNKILQVHIGDTLISISPTDDGTNSFSSEWSNPTWTLQIGTHGSSNFDGDMAEFWLSTTRLDFSVEANRRKFYGADGKPVDVGSDGSTPTGSAPEVYLSVRPGDAAADFCTNRGTGNNFTMNRTLTLASTSPSD